MQHAVMRIIELYCAVGHGSDVSDAADAALDAEVAVAAKQLAEAKAEELQEARRAGTGDILVETIEVRRCHRQKSNTNLGYDML